MNIKTSYIIVVLVAIIATALSLFVVADESLIGSTPINTATRGFPFHFVEHPELPLLLVPYESIKFLPALFSINFSFWLLVSASVYQVIFLDPGRKRTLLPTAVFLGFVFTGISMGRGSCEQGFPIVFNSICGDNDALSFFYRFGGPIIDLAYWCLMGAVTVSFFVWVTHSRLPVLKYILIPIFLTSGSFIYDKPCDGWFCISGRGFPLPYYDDEFSWIVYLVDILLWVVIYIVGKNVFRYLKKKMGKSTA